MEIKFRLEGKPPSGNDLTSGQSSIRKYLRDVRNICIFSGSDLRIPQLVIQNHVRLGAGSPPFGKDTNWGNHGFEFARSLNHGDIPLELKEILDSDTP